MQMIAVASGLRGTTGWSSRLLVASVASLVAAAALSLASPAAARSSVAAARDKCTRHRVAGKRVCLRVGKHCQPALQNDYLKAGLECRGRRLRRAGLAALREGEPVLIDSRGRIDPRNALEAFDIALARLPGIKPRKGAVGKVYDATSIVQAVAAQRKHLTGGQRAVLRRVLRPNQSISAAAIGPAEATKLRNMVGEARTRIMSHGYDFPHPIAVAFPESSASSKPGVEAEGYAWPGWLDPSLGVPGQCTVFLTPFGRSEHQAALRALVAHEVFHCAQLEHFSSPQAAVRVPLWVMEGSAQWAGDQIAREWNGFDIAELAWINWLQKPELDLGRRDYDGIGFWALRQQTGTDVFGLLHDVLRAGAAGGDGSAYAAATASAPDAFWDTWGPGFTRNRVLPSNWDLTGPGILDIQPPHNVIEDGTTVIRSSDPRGAYGSGLSLEADVIEIQAMVSHGQLFDSGPSKLHSEVLLTTDQVECPNGKLDGRRVNKGIADIGWQDGWVTIRGRSVSDECAKQGKGEPTQVPHTPACTLLRRSGVIRFVGGDWLALGNACAGGKCLQEVEKNGQKKCAYGRGAHLDVIRFGTAKEARRYVQRHIAKGFRRIDIGADVAGIATKATGGSVFMAVGTKAAVFSMGATSDTTSHPVWHNEHAVIKFATSIAHLMR